MCKSLTHFLTSSQSKFHHNDIVKCTGVLPLDICIYVCNLCYNHLAEVLYKLL